VPAAAGAAQSSTAPGAPRAKAFWTPANKQGFGTSMTTQSKLWHTLQGGELTEVYYPDLGTPALRDLQLIVTDGRTFTDRESDATNQHVELVDKHSLTYRQVNTAKSGRYRIVKTYVTDPARNALLVDVRFQSLTGRPYQVYAYIDPALNNDGNDDSGTTSHGALLTQDAAAGDRGAAERALDYVFTKQQRPDGSVRQNTLVDGTPHWDGTQQDEVAFPIVLAWQLGRDDAATYNEHVKKAADWLVNTGPKTDMDRWENQDGWSPGTIASEIAGLICAADLARKAGKPDDAARYEAKADVWQKSVESWTATTNGPYSDKPYYLRLTKDANPNDGSVYSIGDSGPRAADERRVVDPSFLELVRLGVKRPDDATIRNSIAVIDVADPSPKVGIAVDTPNGRFWHRFNYDGCGEQLNGDPWNAFDPDTQATLGRAWPIFAGERGSTT
jgi:GH15 family glucan-1,4-alpha-glucosidase